jgi:hypothetical protein
LDLVKPIPIKVLHDRADLTGNNRDETFKNRIIHEGNVEDPLDFNHVDNRNRRMIELNKIAKYLFEKGYKLEHWQNVCSGQADPWSKMMAADVNKHLTTFRNTEK